MTTIKTEILVQYIPLLQEKVAALIKVANKINVPPPVLTFGERRTQRYTDELGCERFVKWVEITLENATPSIEGWEFKAAIEHHATESGYQNLVKLAPAYRSETEGEYHVAAPWCNHCGVNRQRNKTYIFIKPEDGSTIQVGASCMKDFGGRSVSLYSLQVTEELMDTLEEGSSPQRARTIRSIHEVLLASSVVIAEYGYAKSDAERPTKTFVSTYLSDIEFRRGLPAPTADQNEEVVKAIQWVEESTADTDYMRNIKVIVANELTEPKNFGYIVSVLPAYRRATQREVLRAARVPEVTTPVVEGKIEIVGIVTSSDLKDTDWGSRLVMTVKDDRGFKVWGSCPAAISHVDLVGKRVRFTAEVTKSNSDETFGFFKRPSKASVEGE